MNEVKETITLGRRIFYAAVPAASVTLNLCIAAWAMHTGPDIGSCAIWRVLLLAVPFVALLNVINGSWSGAQSYWISALAGFAGTIILWMPFAIYCAFMSLWEWTFYLPSYDGVFSIAAASIIFTTILDLMGRVLIARP
ncbi:hypothetical protein [Erwinia sp. JH02]|uniref:hypothetical protein n=1 Tax=Erwinia sp. JH02 TaxID=2733394 RepID=UPI001489365D|nr:hypothetical protein [Erwinia sp. JH02]NNS09980.1 hypothetical protein [Erwinia sp. JH02]